MNTLIIIPSRLSASRLPGKPLLKIKGLSIISHVFKKAEKANIGEVLVAAEDQDIIDDVKKNGGNAILTSKVHKTGTDRIYEAYSLIKKKNIDYIINIQGDEPDIEVEDICLLNKKMKSNNSQIGTLAANIVDPALYNNENVVKVVTQKSFEETSFPLAETFVRKIKNGINIFHHIGIYCYNVETLKKFVTLKQSKNEIKNKLEQLRALDNNININVAFVRSSPIGINTKEEYIALKKIMEYK